MSLHKSMLGRGQGAKRLSDIIDRVQKQEGIKPKLTFEEWFKSEGFDAHQWDVAKMAWYAGQANKP